MSFRKYVIPLLILSLLALGTVSLFAQSVVSGDLTGTVTDSSGAIVPQATVTLKSENGVSQTTQSNQSGGYHFSFLKPGTYTVSAGAASLQAPEHKVQVQVGQVTTAALVLGAKGVDTTIEVTGEAPLLKTEDANLATDFNSAQIASLPNPGGDTTYYAQTAPGVAMNVGGVGGFGNFTAFGLPATSNLFTLNGNDNNDPFLNLNNSGASNLTLGANELQDIAVVTTGYSAQYGRQGGVQVDSTTKSGGNAFHGNAQYFWNGTTLNANDWFNKHVVGTAATPRPFANNNQYAASFGGPIIKDKLFFFADTEGLRYVLPTTGRVFLPTPAFESAILSNLAATNPGAMPLYNQFFSLYNNAPGAGRAVPVDLSTDPSGNFGCSDFAGTAGFGTAATPCLSTFRSNGKNLNHEWLLATRVDYNLSNSDRLFGRFHVDHGQQPTSTDLINPIFSTNSTQPEYDGQLNETHIFGPNVVNQLVISGQWYSAIFVPDGTLAQRQAAMPFATVDFQGPLLSILGGTQGGAAVTSNFPQGRNVTQYQGIDDLSITRGNHVFKVGGNYRRNDISDYGNSVFTRAQVDVGSLTDFYNGVLNGANGDAFIQNFTTKPRNPLAIYSLGVYFQDEWRVTPNLKLTAAIRADRNSNAVCQNDCFSNLVNQFTSLTHDVNTPFNQVIQANRHSAFQDLEKVALQPRVGFSWSPFGMKNTVVRGGLGIFSDLYQGVLITNLEANTPTVNAFTLTGAALNAPLGPGTTLNGTPDAGTLAAQSNASLVNGFASGATLAQIQASNPFFQPPSFFETGNHINNPKYLKWNLEIQHSLGSKTSVDVNYVGTHGYDELIWNPDVNAFAGAGSTLAGVLPTTVPDARFSTVNELTSTGHSNYDGLITSVTRKYGYGFQGTVSYTWSHALDELTGLPNTPFNVVDSVNFQLNPNNLRANYGNSDEDVRHNLTANYVWELPYKFQNSLLNQTLGGWVVSGTLFARSGVPYSVTDTGFPISNGNPGTGGFATLLAGQTIAGCGSPGLDANNPHLCLNPSQFVASGAETGFGNVPRNSFRGPMYFDTDLSVAKNFSISERMRFTVGANAYNVLNHPNFALPLNNLAFGAGTFGSFFALSPQPTSPYGAFQGAGVAGRLLQLNAKFTF